MPRKYTSSSKKRPIKNLKKSNTRTQKQASKSPKATTTLSRQKFSDKRKAQVLKTITDCIKRSESRISQAQQKLFNSFVKDKIFSKSKTVNSKIQEVVQACIREKVFTVEELEAATGGFPNFGLTIKQLNFDLNEHETNPSNSLFHR